MRIFVPVRQSLFLLAILAVSCASDPVAPANTVAPASEPAAVSEPAAASEPSAISEPAAASEPSAISEPAAASEPTAASESELNLVDTPFSAEPETVFSQDAEEATLPSQPLTPIVTPPVVSAKPEVTKPVTPTKPATIKPTPAKPLSTKPSVIKPAATKPLPAKPATAKADVAKPVMPQATEADDLRGIPEIWEAGVEPASLSMPSEQERMTPSRTATLPEGHTLEVWYPGTGWVYLGDTSAQNGLAYETRKLDKADTLFAFRAVKSGTFLLEFSRYDVVSDEFVSDVLSVTVMPPVPARLGRIRAPDWRSTEAERTTRDAVTADAVGADASQRAVVEPDAIGSAISDEPSLVAAGKQSTVVEGSVPARAGTPGASVENVSPERLIEETRAALAAGDVSRAIAALDSFFTVAVNGLDEGWFLRGQAYEANGSTRDIRKALAAYETVVNAWPESERWKDADGRIRYLKNFYFRGR